MPPTPRGKPRVMSARVDHNGDASDAGDAMSDEGRQVEMIGGRQRRQRSRYLHTDVTLTRRASSRRSRMSRLNAMVVVCAAAFGAISKVSRANNYSCFQIRLSNGFRGASASRLSFSADVTRDIERERARRKSRLDEWSFERLDDPRDFPCSYSAIVEEAVEAVGATLVGSQKPSPNLVGNALSRNVLQYRPAHRTRPESNERVGIEIDGLSCLDGSFRRSEDSSLRYFSILLARELSKDCRVAMFFSSLEESLLAVNDLNKIDVSANISIQCIAQGSLPTSMMKGSERGRIDKSNIVLIVKPSDISMGRLQPGMSDRLQKILFQASSSSIPTVVLSPRLSELSSRERLGTNGLEQSGFQASSSYGGLEPPKQTLWLLRDLVPPAYTWAITKVGSSEGRDCLASVAMRQTAMESGHRYDVFVMGVGRGGDGRADYNYAGSTSSFKGRPTISIMGDVLKNYQDNL